MRQNTKIVVATNRNFSDEGSELTSPVLGSDPGMQPRQTKSAGNSPRKTSGNLTASPWNGKVRRKSQRQSQGPRTEPAPPLPGHESALGVLDEYSTIEDLDEEVERGRVFVKVVGAKDLDLPMPRSKYPQMMLLCIADMRR